MLSVRRRIRLAVLLPAMVIAASVIVLVARERAALLERDAGQRTRILAEQSAPRIGSALHRGDTRAVRAILGDLAVHDGVAVALIRDPAGTARFHVADEGGRDPVALLGHGLFSATTWRTIGLQATRLALPPAVSLNAPGPARNVGWLELQPEPDRVAREYLRGMLPLLFIITALLMVTALLADVAAASVTGPLGRVTRQIRRFEVGHLDDRLRNLDVDEIGALGAALNRMAGSLARGQRTLRDQVRQTTAELQQSIQGVEVQNAKLDVARRRALEASRVKSEFLANVSHEIRTPINGIVGFADQLSHCPLDAEQRDYVNTIRESCTNLLTIVNDILDFSKIEAGKLVIDNVAFDLRDSVEEVLSLLAAAAYGKGLELTALIYADVPLKLYGDPIRIRQVLTNLVHNGIKFTATGGITVRVMVDDETDTRANLRISVTDTGIGLEPADQAKLFQAFGQADTSLTRRFGGTGLGLIISRKLLEQMDGDIALESAPGAGSTFCCSLPLTKQASGAHAATAASELPIAGRHALLVDRDRLSRLAIRHLLERWGMIVTEVDDFAALDGAVAGDWDVAVIGLTRADLTRADAHACLVRLSRDRRPLLALASSVDRSELRALYLRGASASLPKAVRRHTIYRELCRLIAPEGAPGTPHRRGDPLAPEPPPTLSRGCNALVVDDNAINRKLIVTIASRAGARVMEADDGRAAVDACVRERFDIVFMDIHMRNMDGEEATREIHRRLAGDAPRIIALTANALLGERERLLAAGMDGCLIKPVSEAQVLELLAGDTAMIPAPRDAAIDRDRDADLRRDMRAMLQAEVPEHRRRIRRAYRADDREWLREAVHKLHGAASVCHLPALRDICRSLENTIHTGERVAIPAQVARLMNVLAQFEAGAEPTPDPLERSQSN